MQKKIDKTIHLTGNVITILAVIMLCSLLFTRITTGRGSIFGYRVLHVVSESMEPTIMTGDYVLGQITDPADVKVGDIVTYQLKNNNGTLSQYTIIHRVHQINPDGSYVFWGDNNPTPDPLPVQPEQIGFKVLGF